ncbi:type I restriction-modification system, DNA-methyltransferase subunit M [Sulfuriferula multivorans]|uniref:Type I restriction-modification system, DNA-methyltransferase subunit M n=2 Tax=Sulfuriferula multivorans TaxID=1559896 RepID=A0A401JBL5_9PROT|nr:type I restriction-modification system, DNA-methyltransferase subunit M [Sulfuriferula multivorans]
MPTHRPSWFSDDKIMVSTAPTCGLTKGGRLLPKIDPATGKRIQTIDPETGASIDAINDQLLEDVEALVTGKITETLRFVPRADVSMRLAVPAYYESRHIERFREAMQEERFAGFSSATIGELAKKGIIEIRNGHGSPSHDQRVGKVPYIKVSDLRAGMVNINPTNRVPKSVAEAFWRGPSSGLRAFDLICPERTSKNIGDFCMLMPGQEQVVTTKEVIVLRPGSNADFDAFYLLWAMTLKVVRDQWKRVVFMQTNREDVGSRYLEIEIPIPPNRGVADAASYAFRQYYTSIADARVFLGKYLSEVGDHHFFVSGAEISEPEIELIDDQNDLADLGTTVIPKVSG